MRDGGGGAKCLEVRDVAEDLGPVVEEQGGWQDLRAHFGKQRVVE